MRSGFRDDPEMENVLADMASRLINWLDSTGIVDKFIDWIEQAENQGDESLNRNNENGICNFRYTIKHDGAFDVISII